MAFPHLELKYEASGRCVLNSDQDFMFRQALSFNELQKVFENEVYEFARGAFAEQSYHAVSCNSNSHTAFLRLKHHVPNLSMLEIITVEFRVNKI